MRNRPCFRAATLAIAALGPCLAEAAQAQVDSTAFDRLAWRMIGPYRGGRVTAVAGVPSQPRVYYLGATGGGVWKTTTAGLRWEPVTDSTGMAGSIGAIAVAPSDPNVVYVGTGEGPPRGNVSPGNGMYKSTDAGRSWRAIGLEDAGQIVDLYVHPEDPDRVYAAVLGHIFGPNSTRGVYRSADGGETWERVLARDDRTGAVDLAVDPTNPRIMYAALWQVRRRPYALESGGPGSGLFKSVDGGSTWTEITRNAGMPEGIVGKIGVTVSPARPDRVWAIVEAEEGGVFRSDDGGDTWERVNDERSLRQRAWYYTHIYADPRDPETVYVLNVRLHRSVDGGKTFSQISAPHSDHHALWIAPDDPRRMVEGNDGGANVSFDGGETWTGQDMQPTAQMYHGTATSEFHFQVCGGQQDNSTICVPSRTDNYSGISRPDYRHGGGCESGFVTSRPDDPGVSYAGCYGGSLTRYDRATGQERSISVWPDNPMGWGAGALRYRFQWTFPIVLSPHDPDVLYVASQHVHRSTDEGQSWQVISPDLTRNDKARLGPSGGPITKDNTSVEYYGTIFALTPSPHDPAVLWAGSDDGRVHVTRDGGTSWVDVTPRDLPEWALISFIEASPHRPGTVYVTATRYKSDDFAPYIYRTEDFGRRWQRITDGIPPEHFVRVVRADPDRAGLLYAGGEFGVYVSFDDGTRWQSLRLNLPVVPVHDMQVVRRDLVIATHGRGFWVLDDLTPLHQLTDEVARARRHLFRPRDVYRLRASGPAIDATPSAPNPPRGAVVYFHLAAEPEEEVVVEYLEADGDVIRRFSTAAAEDTLDAGPRAGMNRHVWDLRYPGATDFEDMILWSGSTSGPVAVPGTYQVRLTVGAWSATQPFEVMLDPRSGATVAELQEQFDFLIALRDRTSEANDAVREIRSMKAQLEDAIARAAGHALADTIALEARRIAEALSEVEAEIYQVKNRSRQDPLNFPIKLNNKLASLAGVVGRGDHRPTDQAREVFARLSAQLEEQLARLRQIVATELPRFNGLVGDAALPAVSRPEAPEGPGRPGR